MRPAAALLAGALALLPACSPGPESPPAPARGGTLVVGTISDVDSWNEYLSRQTFANNLHRRIWPRLLRPRPDGTFEGQLAASWDLAPDGRALTVRLRDARWADGRPVTSDDVRFTWQAQVAPEVGWVGADGKSRIAAVDAPDPRTAVFRFTRPDPFALAAVSEGGILPGHARSAIPFAQWRARDWSGDAWGCGPFRLAAHRPMQEIVLERASGGLVDPPVDRVTVRIVPDMAALLTQLRAGEIDLVDGVPPREAAGLRAAGIAVEPYASPMVDFVGWNASRPPLDDPAVRTALTLALDRAALVEELLHGHGAVASGPLPSSSPLAAAAPAPLPADREEARRRLAARGFGPDRPLRLSLATNLGNPVREAALVKIQAQLAAAGVEAQVRPMEMGALRAAVEAGEVDGYLGGWRITGRPDLTPLFGSTRTPAEGNTVRYRSAEADAALARLDAAATREEALAAGAEVLALLHRDQPCTFLWEARRLLALGPRVRLAGPVDPADPLDVLERASLGDASRP